MQTRIEDYDYSLPPELVAHYPAEPRDASRLLVLDRKDGSLAHAGFRDLPRWLDERDFLVVNDTRVFPARLVGHKATGGRVELLLHHLPETEAGGGRQGAVAQAGYRARRRLKLGQTLDFGPGLAATLHVAATFGGAMPVEFPTGEYETPFLVRPIEAREGRVAVPAGPGLGVEINEEAIRRHPYSSAGPV